MSDWKTTLAGIGALLIALGAIIQGIVKGDYSIIGTQFPAIITAVGLILAADGKARQ